MDTKNKPNRLEAGVKVLLWDIETAPNLGFFWRAGYDQHILPDSIVKERKVITIAWKWLGQRQTYFLTWDKHQDDRSMLEKFMVVAHEADILVAHYGDRFDLPWFKTRCLIHGLEPLPPYKTVDTKAWASKYFYFNSNKLDYIGEVLGEGRKIKTEYQMWLDIVLKNCPKALAKMARYNVGDVRLLERVYNRLKFCVKPKTHAGVAAGGARWTCPRDGSEDVHLDKVRVTASGVKQFQMQCNKCGGYFTINGVAFDAYKKEKQKNG